MENVELHAAVTDIGDGAFGNCRKLKTLSLSSGVKTIGEYAFYSCTSLVTVEIPAQVELIKTYAFAECRDLRNVMFQGKTTGLTSYAFQGNNKALTLWGYSDTGVQRYAAAEGIRFTPYGEKDSVFYGTCDDGLTWRVTKDGVLVISGTCPMRHYTYTIRPPWEFLAGRITAVVIEDGVINLSDELFKGYPEGSCSGYPKLTELTIGSTVSDLGSETFVNCPALERIILSADNETYLLKDNVIYSADGKTLVLYPCGRKDTSFTVPNGVTAIGDHAFRNRKNLKQVVLPEGLFDIGSRSFDRCTGIEGLVLPSTLLKAGESAFHSCRVKTDRTALSSAVSSRNLNAHQYVNYGRWTDVIRSHMAKNEDGSPSRVEYVNGQLIVERYVRNGREIQWESGFRLRIDYELPIFGHIVCSKQKGRTGEQTKKTNVSSRMVCDHLIGKA